jgi:hypothetical protein
MNGRTHFSKVGAAQYIEKVQQQARIIRAYQEGNSKLAAENVEMKKTITSMSEKIAKMELVDKRMTNEEERLELTVAELKTKLQHEECVKDYFVDRAQVESDKGREREDHITSLEHSNEQLQKVNQKQKTDLRFYVKAIENYKSALEKSEEKNVGLGFANEILKAQRSKPTLEDQRRAKRIALKVLVVKLLNKEQECVEWVKTFGDLDHELAIRGESYIDSLKWVKGEIKKMIGQYNGN